MTRTEPFTLSICSRGVGGALGMRGCARKSGSSGWYTGPRLHTPAIGKSRNESEIVSLSFGGDSGTSSCLREPATGSL